MADFDNNNLTTIEKLLNKLNDLVTEVKQGELNNIKHYVENLLKHFSFTKELVEQLYSTNKKCITQNVLIDIALQLKSSDVLRYLLQDTFILFYLKNPYLTEDKTIAQMTSSFVNAIHTNDINRCEMIYSFWCNNKGTDVRDEIHDRFMDKIRITGLSLHAASLECKHYLDRHQQLQVDINCLNQFHKFQEELYTELKYIRFLSDPNAANIEVEVIRNTILTILRVYDNYSTLEKVRIPFSLKEKEEFFKNFLKENNDFYTRSLVFVMYKLYFQKIEFLVSSIIFNYLDFIRKQLDISDKLYNEIERTVCHYIYRNHESCRLFLPETNEVWKEKLMCYSEGAYYYTKERIEMDNLKHGALLFLESNQFKKYLKELYDKIEPNNQTEKIQNNVSDVYSSRPLPQIKVYCLLEYNIQTMEEVIEMKYYDFNDNDAAAIKTSIKKLKRILDTAHNKLRYSFYNKFSTYVTLSTEIREKLATLRHELNQHKCMTENKNKYATQVQVNEILTDLKRMKSYLKTIQKLCKPVINKSLLYTAVNLVNEKLQSISDKVGLHTTEYIFKHYIGLDHNDLLSQFQETFPQLSDLCIKEIMWLTLIKRDLKTMKKKVLSKQNDVDNDKPSKYNVYKTETKHELNLIEYLYKEPLTKLSYIELLKHDISVLISELKYHPTIIGNLDYLLREYSGDYSELNEFLSKGKDNILRSVLSSLSSKSKMLQIKNNNTNEFSVTNTSETEIVLQLQEIYNFLEQFVGYNDDVKFTDNSKVAKNMLTHSNARIYCR